MTAIDPYDPSDEMHKRYYSTDPSVVDNKTNTYDDNVIHQTVYDMTIEGKLKWITSPNFAFTMVSSSSIEEIKFQSESNGVKVEISKHHGQCKLKIGGYVICPCSDELYNAIEEYIDIQTNAHKMERINRFFTQSPI